MGSVVDKWRVNEREKKKKFGKTDVKMSGIERRAIVGCQLTHKKEESIIESK